MTAAPVLPGCSVLPPMEPTTAAASNGKAGRHKPKAPDRFGVFNAFVDLTIRELRRADLISG